MQTRILFSTDLHGSDPFFLKILTTARENNVDILFISGDLTGKAIEPIVEFEKDKYATTFFGRQYSVNGAELANLKREICGQSH